MQQSTDWLHVVAKAVAFDSVPLNPVVSDADGFAICDVQSTWSADPYSLYSTVADQGVSVTRRVIQIGESEVPFVSLRTLLVHDKALLGVLPKRDTEFTEIWDITEIASRHSDPSRRIWSSISSLYPYHVPPDLHRLYLGHTTCSVKRSRATHAAASIRGINHF